MSEASPSSPVAVVGTIALLAAYGVAAWCVAAGIAGNARQSRRLTRSAVYGLYGFGALIGLASALMVYAIVTHDYAIKYVASVSDTTMSTAYKITAFWGGLDGSLLFWVLALALFSTVAIVTNHRRHRDMIGYVVATIMVVQVFFLSLLIFTKNPFATYLTSPPTDGQGLNPLLQNYWMIIHPPSLYVGFVAATIPFAFGIGALASGRLDDLWLGSVRVWMLICFGFLSLGLILGGRWAYEELGWGGYWAWDPVENAGLIPWFTATAFLHSAIIQEQRGMMKRWNMVLVIVTFFFTIFGTFMTRSGIVQSVHAFGADNVLALQFVAFLGFIIVVSIGLLVYRSNQLSSKMQLESFFSREFAFLANNWILLACALVVLFLTMLPTISEAFDGSRMSVGIEYFNRMMTPLGLVLLLLAGVAPLLAWRKTTRERLWNQFLMPMALMAVVVVVLVLVFPQTRQLSTLFTEGLELRIRGLHINLLHLPVTLINFGLCAFVFGSIVQEFWRGVGVRRRQSGGDPISSLAGLVLAKRRKYGGYIIHLGVAVMFFGFAGKAYEEMKDATIERPAAVVADRAKATVQFRGYDFVYEELGTRTDDHKSEVFAKVSIWRNGELIENVYPAKWDYQKGEGQATTEVAITVRFAEDVYVVLTGYDLESQLANLRIYVNPLISWVWVGFLILALGTLICLVPQVVVDRWTRRWTSPIGRVGQAGKVSVAGLLVIGALGAFGWVGARALDAHAAAPAEHVPSGMGMGADGTGYAAMNRPTNETEARAMKELLCNCGGCQRESFFDCKCSTASQLRRQVMDFLGQVDANGKPVFDLSTERGRDSAYAAVLDYFVKTYGGEQLLATPRTQFSWLFPVVAVIGGLGLLVVAGRRLINRGAAVAAAGGGAAIAGGGGAAIAGGAAGAASPAADPKAADADAYADKLDDELADIE